MLVDLGRNDINRICVPTSTNVGALMTVEKYSHVMHIVSHVSGKLRDECSPFDAFRSIFPAGTVSGAPKVKAMEWIAALEKVPTFLLYSLPCVFTGSLSVHRRGATSTQVR